MKIPFSIIEDAFFYISSAPMYSNQATLCKESGEIVYSSEYSDVAEDKIPDDIYEREDCIPRAVGLRAVGLGRTKSGWVGPRQLLEILK